MVTTTGHRWSRRNSQRPTRRPSFCGGFDTPTRIFCHQRRCFSELCLHANIQAVSVDSCVLAAGMPTFVCRSVLPQCVRAPSERVVCKCRPVYKVNQPGITTCPRRRPSDRYGRSTLKRTPKGRRGLKKNVDANSQHDVRCARRFTRRPKSRNMCPPRRLPGLGGGARGGDFESGRSMARTLISNTTVWQ